MKKHSVLTGLVVGFAALTAPGLALAEGGGSGGAAGWIAIAAAITMALAALAGTTAQGRAVAAALESMGRNPSAANKIQTAMLLGLAFIESLVIFSFVILFLRRKK